MSIPLRLKLQNKMRAKVDKILSHGCNVFINRQLIYNFSEEIFAMNNVMAIEHADFDGTKDARAHSSRRANICLPLLGIERLAAVTGGEIVSTFDNPDRVTLGECELIEEILIGEEKVAPLHLCGRGEAEIWHWCGADDSLLWR